MVSALVRAYRLTLSFYPAAFRRRYADEMRLDFEDGLHEAVAAGALAALRFACRAAVDTCASLLREWSRGTRAATAAAATAITIALWGLALRPWAWKPSIRPQSRGSSMIAPVEVWELIVMAVVALVPVIVLIVIAPRLVQRAPIHRRRPPCSGQPGAASSNRHATPHALTRSRGGRRPVAVRPRPRALG